MRILVSGSHGLIGTALLPFLAARQHEVIALVRTEARPGHSEVRWEPGQGGIDAAALGRLDAAIHLAGENLASGRWTRARKTRIRQSRVAGTRLLSEALAHLAQPPGVLLSASAVGYYGDRGDETLTEASSPGTGFLTELCQDWEAATGAAIEAGWRVCHLRFGVILSRQGGALARMLPVFRLGLGGRLGSGCQFWSWIAIDDVLSAVTHVLTTATLHGAVNIVSPQPARNREFTQILAGTLKRPAIVPAPRWALKLALGEMAEAALLSSARVMPAKLTEAGFSFRFPELRLALAESLKR
jgi:uncharacterized protein (TIGR01777 family)